MLFLFHPNGLKTLEINKRYNLITILCCPSTLQSPLELNFAAGCKLFEYFNSVASSFSPTSEIHACEHFNFQAGYCNYATERKTIAINMQKLCTMAGGGEVF